MGWCEAEKRTKQVISCHHYVVQNFSEKSNAINGATASAVRFYLKSQSLRNLLTALAEAPFIAYSPTFESKATLVATPTSIINHNIQTDTDHHRALQISATTPYILP